ncbi:hypothetical protein [Streptomyces meridianus]|uniref:Uncharacterized protein n=1 Tax=Streptomyces meridianus TaxID=2938945 RepID=A0ABT0XET8_9ACTN|nr:hypothetical protein [Streptomyces meridianus]MCM2580458.1 hypothetical protein [Streptomyces meridianus]
MKTHRIAIEGDGLPGSTNVLLDGRDIGRGLTGLTLTLAHDRVPHVELDLVVVDATRVGSVEAEVVLGSGVADTLVALGWTPPAEESEPDTTGR